MVHSSDAQPRSRLTIRSASLAVALVGASLGLALAVRSAGWLDAAPVAPSAASTAPGTPSPLTRWVSSISSIPSSLQTSPAAQTPSATSLTIQGVPPAGVNYNSPYSFTPRVSGTAGTGLAFSIQNKPAWAAFDSSNGALTGTPGPADVGTDANIVIRVSDGRSTTALAAFSISVNESSNGAATLDWTPVTQTAADTTLTGVAGYIVYYGTSADNLNQRVKLENPGLTSYMVTNLASGTWYFGIAAYTRSGVEGVISSIVQKTIP
jgi:hypothetical protein